MNQAACIWIENSKGQIVLVTRPGGDTVGLPGGKKEVGENAQQTALRELQEETGIVLADDSGVREVFKAVCFGEVDYETTTFHVQWDGEIPGGIEPDLTAYWGDKSELLTNSPFRAYNDALITSMIKLPIEVV